MPDHLPALIDWQQLKLAWEVLGEADDGPREARAIYHSRTGAVSKVVSSWSELRAFCEKHAKHAMLCIAVQPVRENFPDGRAATDRDIQKVCNVFIDIDCTSGSVDELIPQAVEILNTFCEERDFVPFTLADSGNGIHAYSFFDPIYTDQTKDISNRLAMLQREIRTAFADVEGAKVDSVFNLSRVVKLVGTKKPSGVKLSRFLDPKPTRTLDDVLRTWLLDLKVEVAKGSSGATIVDHALSAELELVREEIEAEVQASPRLRKLRELCAIANDRSKAEYQFTRELWMRKFYNARAVAAVKVGIKGSKSNERGFSFALDDTGKVFRECEENPIQQPSKDDKEPWIFSIGEWSKKVDAMPKDIWCDKPFIAESSKCVWAGDPKSFKSMVLIESAIRMAMADRRVLYVAAEGDLSEWTKRFNMLAAGLGTKIEDLPQLRFGYRPKRVDLSDPTTLTELRAFVLDVQPSVVFLDPLRNLMHGDENDSEVARQAMDSLDWMAEDTPVLERPAWVVVHHLRKPQNSKFTDGTSYERPGAMLRGSTQLWANADTIAAMRKQTDMQDMGNGTKVGRASLIIEHRHADEVHLRAIVKVTPDSYKIDYRVRVGETDTEARICDQVIDYLELAAPNGGASVSDIRNKVVGNNASVGNVLKELAKKNYIVKSTVTGRYSIGDITLLAQSPKAIPKINAQDA